MTQSTLNISEAAGLAIHAVTIIARKKEPGPIKLSDLAGQMGASVTHLGKVMNRLVLAQVVSSKRGPAGGFTLGPRASQMTLLDIQEIFDGPLGCTACVLGHTKCPFGECVLGNTIEAVNAVVQRELGQTRITDL